MRKIAWIVVASPIISQIILFWVIYFRSIQDDCFANTVAEIVVIGIFLTIFGWFIHLANNKPQYMNFLVFLGFSSLICVLPFVMVINLEHIDDPFYDRMFQFVIDTGLMSTIVGVVLVLEFFLNTSVERTRRKHKSCVTSPKKPAFAV